MSTKKHAMPKKWKLVKPVPDSMETTFAKTDEIIDGVVESPLELSVIPNYMGINLISVEGLSWTRQKDGQLVSLVIHFLPDPDGPDGDERRAKKKARRAR